MLKHVALVIALAITPLAQVDVPTIIQRSMEANAADWKAAPEYDCIERDLQPGGGTKTYDDYMILGSPYQRLVAINGLPLSPADQMDEQRKLEAVSARRRDESPEERADRIAKYEKDRRRNQLMMEQLAKAFNFALAGEQKLDDHEVYVLKATPRPDYQPPNLETQALRGMQGKLWIDTQTFQWVKVEAQVIHPVSIEGFLAQVEPGTRFELEKMPVEDDIWLARHFAMRSQARVLFFFHHRSQEDDTFYDYHKATSRTEHAP